MKRGWSRSLCLNCGKRKLTNQYMLCEKCLKGRER